MSKTVYVVCEYEYNFDCMTESHKPIKAFRTEKSALGYVKEQYLFDYEIKEIPLDDDSKEGF